MQKNKYKDIEIGREYKKSWKYFFSFYLKFPKRTIIIIITSFLASGITISLPFISQLLIKSTNNSVLNLFIILSSTIILINIIKIILDFINEYLGNYYNFKLETYWRESLIKRTHQLPLMEFENRSMGSFLSRIVNDLKDLTNFAYQFLSSIIFVTCTLLGGFIYIFITSFWVGLVLFSVLIISFLIYFLFIKKLIINRQYVKELNSRVDWETTEHIELISEIKSYGNSNINIDNYLKLQNRYLLATKSINFKFALFKILGIASNVLITSLILILSSFWNMKSIIDSDQVFGLTTAANILVLPITNLSKIFVDFAHVSASVVRLYNWDKMPIESNRGTLKPEFKGKIEFKNVSFSYKLANYNEIKVFEDFNLTLEPNQTTKLLGKSASGKSTILKLLMRFYSVDSGQILIDGIPIEDIELNHLRQSINYQSSNPKLFTARVYSREMLDDEKRYYEIVQLLGMEEAHKKLSWVNTNINSQGIQISQSEKQLLSFARAIYFRNNIILLDSIESYLDYEQIEKVNLVLEKYCKDKTIIFTSSKKTDLIHYTNHIEI